MTLEKAVRLVLGLVLLLVLPAGAARAEEAANACPHFLQAWLVSGGFDDGEEWAARLVTVRGDRARIEELRIVSETPKVSEADLRWFLSDPPDPEPVEVRVGSKVLLEDPLQGLCREFSTAGFATIQAKAVIDEKKKSTGQIDERRIEMTVTDVQNGMRVGVHATPVPAKSAAAGAAATAPKAGAPVGRRNPSLVLEQEDLSEETPEVDAHGAPAPRPTPAAAKARERAKVALAAIKGVVEKYSHTIGAAPNEFASVPAARRILETLDGVDDAGLPAEFPSPFQLESAAAPRDYAVALALEILAQDDEDENDDRLAALRKLGDQATPAATDDLILVLQDAAGSKSQAPDAALALRALLKIDPDQARTQAARRLSASGPVLRAALGVFAATEKSFSQELAALDLEDQKKVADVAARLKRHLAETATDPALRRAAGGS